MQRLTAEAEQEPGSAGVRYAVIGLMHLESGRDLQATEALKKADSRLADDAMISFYLARAFSSVGHHVSRSLPWNAPSIEIPSGQTRCRSTRHSLGTIGGETERTMHLRCGTDLKRHSPTIAA